LLFGSFHRRVNCLLRSMGAKFFFLFFIELGLELSLHIEPLHQLFFVLGFFDIGSCKLFAPGLALNH
jgi:hypothetical protein